MSTLNKIGPFKPSPFYPNSGLPPFQTIRAASPKVGAQPKSDSGLPNEDTPAAMNAKLAEFIRAFIDAAS